VSDGEDPKSSWQQVIRELEIARERGQSTYALERLCAIRSKAIEQGNLEAVGLATAHIVVCYKHLYQNTGSNTYLLTMENELKDALACRFQIRLKQCFGCDALTLNANAGAFNKQNFAVGRHIHSLIRTAMLKRNALAAGVTPKRCWAN
jgi:hypothetical protein